MPELPEVESIVRQLGPAVVGRRIARVTRLRGDVLHGRVADWRRLPGGRVAAVRRRAKRLMIDVAPSLQLTFHLGMSGRLQIVPVRAPLENHTHLRVRFTDAAEELRFVDPRRFGGVWITSGGEAPTGRCMGEVGPEPLELGIREFRRILQRPTAIKALLMDQRRIAGLGNIYCCEALHRAGVHPCMSARQLDAWQARRLLEEIKHVLREAIAHQGSTYMSYRGATGEEGSFQEFHRVYQREGHACRTCGRPIERLVMSGRSTFFCATCQPGTGLVR